jgi:transcriptional regulator with XRE-family HTH domain
VEKTKPQQTRLFRRTNCSYPTPGEGREQDNSDGGMRARSGAQQAIQPAGGGDCAPYLTAYVFAMSANIRNMKTPDLGQELRRLRKEAGMTLRGLAATLEVSAAHLSDIEHNRRRPSDELLRKIARAHRKSGATFASLEHLATGLDRDTREWAASTPGVRKLLRTLKQSGRRPLDLLPVLEKIVGRKGGRTRQPARPKRKERAK